MHVIAYYIRVVMYVCPKIYIRRALSEKVTVAPKKSQSRRGLKQTETSSVPVWTVQWTRQLSAERMGDCLMLYEVQCALSKNILGQQMQHITGSVTVK